MSSQKRKRIKVEYFDCGSHFYNDYRSTHEKNIHEMNYLMHLLRP